MNIGLVYLGILLLLGGCFLYMKYNLKNINLRITTLMELITALTSEMELMQKNIGLTNNSSDNITKNSFGGSLVNNINTDPRELVSEDEDEDEHSDDEEDESEDEEEVGLIEDITIDDSKNGDGMLTLNKNIEILEFDKNTEYDKMTVAELKKLVKDKNPEISITKLKKDELISILLNN